LANLIHRQDISRLFHSFVAVMAQALDERSPYNRSHTQNVARYCDLFTLHLSANFPPDHPYHFDEDRREALSLAALLHDIGKIITPLAIMDKTNKLGTRLQGVRYRFEIKRHQLEIDRLAGKLTIEARDRKSEELAQTLAFIEEVNNADFLSENDSARIQALTQYTYENTQGEIIPLLDAVDLEALSVPRGTLTQQERDIMQDHVSITGRMLDQIALWRHYKNVPDWARGHHELLDGSGYPMGLKGDELPLETCIITIMDIFDALTAADRP